MVTIKARQIKSVVGAPYRIPARDADGNIVLAKAYKDSVPMSEREIKLVIADTRRLIYHIIVNIPPTAQAPNDGMNSYLLLAQLEGKGDIKLEDTQYSWLVRLLSERKVPLSREERESGVAERTYGQWLFGLNDYFILQQLAKET